MARAAKVATKPKKKTVRTVRRGVNRFALAPTDNWNKAKHFVHYEIESKEWANKVKDYIRNNYDRKTVAAINKLPDWKTNNYSHWACTAFLLEVNPSVIPKAYKTGIVKWVEGLAEEGQKLAEEKLLRKRQRRMLTLLQFKSASQNRQKHNQRLLKRGWKALF